MISYDVYVRHHGATWEARAVDYPQLVGTGYNFDRAYMNLREKVIHAIERTKEQGGRITRPRVPDKSLTKYEGASWVKMTLVGDKFSD